MRRSLTLGVLVAALALVAAGCVGFSVTKEVTGGGEPDGPFTVLIACENEGSDELDFEGDASDYPQTEETAFDLDEEGDASCLITEPEAANATATTIECGSVPDSVTCTENPDGSLLVEVDDDPPSPPEDPVEPFVLVDIIVTNDIPATTTTTAPVTPTTVDPNALAIVTSPNFTG